MYSRAQLLLIGGILLLFAGCASAEKTLQESGLQPLSGPELQKLFAGSARSAKWVNDRTNGTIKYSSSGAVSVTWVGKGGGADTGKWRIVGNTVRTKWKKIRKGKEGCFRVYNTKGSTYRYVLCDGRYNSDVTFEN